MTNYNVTALTNSSDILEFAVAVNTLSGELFFTVVSMMILLVAFVSMKRFDSSAAFASATFISTFLTAILWAVGLVGETVLLAHFVLFVLSVAFSQFSS